MSLLFVLIKEVFIVEEGGKYLILVYMSLKDGMLDVGNVDMKLFNCLKMKYGFVFLDKDLDKYVRNMVGYFLLRNEDDGSYEFDLNIMKKIIFVSLVKDDVLFVLMNCKNIYLKYVIFIGLCFSDMDDNYIECFIIIW